MKLLIVASGLAVGRGQRPGPHDAGRPPNALAQHPGRHKRAPPPRAVPAWCDRAIGTLVEFRGGHKSGTKLRAVGAVCLNEFLARADVPVGVRLVNKQGCKAETYRAKPVSRRIYWTRDPFDWLVSNYLYDRRGDEKKRWFPAMLQDPVVSAGLAAALPDFDYSVLPRETFEDWLKRLPVTEGLAFELFLRLFGPDVSAYMQRTRSNLPGRFPELVLSTQGERIGADAAPRAGPPAASSNVCLEDFMSDPARTHRAWHAVLRVVAPDAVPDAALEQCIADHDTTASLVNFENNTGPHRNDRPHGTYRTVSPTELDAMLQAARDLDARFFGGKYAAEARKIGCKTTRAARRRFI